MARSGNEEIIVAKFTHEGQTYVGKRRVTFYATADCGGDAEVADLANRGLKLREQASIREAVKAKHGLKKVSTGEAQVDLSDVDEV